VARQVSFGAAPKKSDPWAGYAKAEAAAKKMLAKGKGKTGAKGGKRSGGKGGGS
jgi:hypothetical protein